MKCQCCTLVTRDGRPVGLSSASLNISVPFLRWCQMMEINYYFSPCHRYPGRHDASQLHPQVLTPFMYSRPPVIRWSTNHCNALYCIVLYYTVLYCTVLYCTVLYCTVLHCTVLYCTALYCTALYCTVLYCNTLYCIVLYCTVLYYTVLYCTVLHCTNQHNCAVNICKSPVRILTALPNVLTLLVPLHNSYITVPRRTTKYIAMGFHTILIYRIV